MSATGMTAGQVPGACGQRKQRLKGICSILPMDSSWMPAVLLKAGRSYPSAAAAPRRLLLLLFHVNIPVEDTIAMYDERLSSGP